jgi:hypothetical protein
LRRSAGWIALSGRMPDAIRFLGYDEAAFQTDGEVYLTPF